ncbi:MAG: M56 family metallopeptidase [Rhizobiaceae bacterium]|nr:M56 family metallopeptidase [Rhizobiaceae bacterium]
MITIDAIFDAYINVNILLIVVFGLWCIARMLLRPLGMIHAYTTQLRLLNGVFLAVAISPFLFLLLGPLSKLGAVTPLFTVNLSDIVVAQYLQGNFDMKPAMLEEFLGFRSRLASDVLELNSNWGIFILGFILAGAALFSARLIISIYALRRIISHSHVWHRFGNLRLLISDTVHVPFSTRTLNRRYVVIPSSMLTNVKDLRIAIGHEFQHMRQYDLEWEIALELLRPIFFWNPAYYLWKRQVEQLRELSCDQRVLARKRYDAKDYCACLLHVCQNSLEKRRLLAIALPKVALIQMNGALFGRNPAMLLRQRVVSLLEGNVEKYPKTIFLALMIPLLAVVTISAIAIQRPDDWSQDRIMLSTIVNLERLAKRNSLAGDFLVQINDNGSN